MVRAVEDAMACGDMIRATTRATHPTSGIATMNRRNAVARRDCCVAIVKVFVSSTTVPKTEEFQSDRTTIDYWKQTCVSIRARALTLKARQNARHEVLLCTRRDYWYECTKDMRVPRLALYLQVRLQEPTPYLGNSNQVNMMSNAVFH